MDNSSVYCGQEPRLRTGSYQKIRCANGSIVRCPSDSNGCVDNNPLYCGQESNKTLETWTCNCPPSFAVWACTEKHYEAIYDGTACAYYQHNGTQYGSPRTIHCVDGSTARCPSGSRGCMDNSSIYCGQELRVRPRSYQKIHCANGSTVRCPSGSDGCVDNNPLYCGNDPSNRVEAFECNCPPSDTIWRCTKELYEAILDGTDCAFYQRNATFECSCPPSDAVWECTREQHKAIHDGTTCNHYRRKSLRGANSAP